MVVRARLVAAAAVLGTAVDVDAAVAVPASNFPAGADAGRCSSLQWLDAVPEFDATADAAAHQEITLVYICRLILNDI